MPRLPNIAKPQLDAEWRTVLRHAWSVRLMALVFLLSIMEVVLPLLDLPLPRVVTAILIGLSTAGAFYARLVAQKQFRGENDE